MFWIIEISFRSSSKMASSLGVGLEARRAPAVLSSASLAVLDGAAGGEE